MYDQGTSVTLIFYRVGNDWWREPALNLIAAAAQLSSYTHVELAIGEVTTHKRPPRRPPCLTVCARDAWQTAGANGQMANVVRIFNDPIGVVRKPGLSLTPSYPHACPLFVLAGALRTHGA